jgi:hypothetical protein
MDTKVPFHICKRKDVYKERERRQTPTKRSGEDSSSYSETWEAPRSPSYTQITEPTKMVRKRPRSGAVYNSSGGGVLVASSAAHVIASKTMKPDHVEKGHHKSNLQSLCQQRTTSQQWHKGSQDTSTTHNEREEGLLHKVQCQSGAAREGRIYCSNVNEKGKEAIVPRKIASFVPRRSPFFQRSTSGVWDDILRLIATHLSLPDVSAFAAVSKEFSRIFNEGSCLKQIALKLFPNIDVFFEALSGGSKALSYLDKLRTLKLGMRARNTTASAPIFVNKEQREAFKDSLRNDYSFLLRFFTKKAGARDGLKVTNEVLVVQGEWSFDGTLSLELDIDEHGIEIPLWPPMVAPNAETESVKDDSDSVKLYEDEASRRTKFSLGLAPDAVLYENHLQFEVFVVEKKIGRIARLLITSSSREEVDRTDIDESSCKRNCVYSDDRDTNTIFSQPGCRFKCDCCRSHRTEEPQIGVWVDEVLSLSKDDESSLPMLKARTVRVDLHFEVFHQRFGDIYPMPLGILARVLKDSFPNSRYL